MYWIIYGSTIFWQHMLRLYTELSVAPLYSVHCTWSVYVLNHLWIHYILAAYVKLSKGMRWIICDAAIFCAAHDHWSVYVLNYLRSITFTISLWTGVSMAPLADRITVLYESNHPATFLWLYVLFGSNQPYLITWFIITGCALQYHFPCILQIDLFKAVVRIGWTQFGKPQKKFFLLVR